MVLGRPYEDIRKDFINDFSQQGVTFDETEKYLKDQGVTFVHKELYGFSSGTTAKEEMLMPFASVHVVRVLQYTDVECGHLVVMDGKGHLFCPQKSPEKYLRAAYAVTDVLGIYK